MVEEGSGDNPGAGDDPGFGEGPDFGDEPASGDEGTTRGFTIFDPERGFGVPSMGHIPVRRSADFDGRITRWGAWHIRFPNLWEDGLRRPALLGRASRLRSADGRAIQPESRQTGISLWLNQEGWPSLLSPAPIADVYSICAIGVNCGCAGLPVISAPCESHRRGESFHR
jgi:hypothetical protein